MSIMTKMEKSFSPHLCSVMLTLVLMLLGPGCSNYLGPDSEASRINERIEAKVKIALAQHPNLDVAPINVIADGGVVTLTGFVEDDSQRRLATEAARTVTAVDSVMNKIEIK